MESRSKKFINVDEQIQILKNRGLTIIDEIKLKKYLTQYSYHVLVNGYNDPFLMNYDRKTEKYKQTANSNNLISLFEFDKKIAFIIIKRIFDIERRISSVISYVIMEQHKKEIPPLANGLILMVSDEELLNIFPRLTFDNKIKEKEKEKIDQNIIKLKKTIADFDELKRSANYFDEIKYYATPKDDKEKSGLSDDDIKSIPIWTLSTKWTFGSSATIFTKLSIKLKQKAIKCFFHDSISHVDDETCKSFGYLLCELSKIRNVVCHNERIYKKIISRNVHFIRNFSTKILDLCIGNNVIKTFDLIKILGRLWDDEGKCINEFAQAFESIATLGKDSLEWIKIQLNYSH